MEAEFCAEAFGRQVWLFGFQHDIRRLPFQLVCQFLQERWFGRVMQIELV